MSQDQRRPAHGIHFRPSTGQLGSKAHDPGLLSTLSTTKYRDRRWTLGDGAHFSCGNPEGTSLGFTHMACRPRLLAGVLAYFVVR